MNRPAILAIIAIALVTAVGVFLIRNARDGDVEAGQATTTTEAGSDPTSSTEDLDDPTTTEAGGSTTTTDESAEGPAPAFEEAPCDFDLITDRPHRCGYVAVPADRSDPGGDQVRLHVAIFEGTSDGPADPIVYLDGGPGGESLAPLQFTLEDTWEPFLGDRDLIFFDQRGIGASEPTLECPETRELTFDTLDADLEPDEYVALENEAIEECHARLVGDAIDVGDFTSATNAADVADLRVALGYDEWNLLGISYGTRLAQTVMRDHPEGVRSVILDSAYPLDADLFAELPTNFDRALEVFFAGCETDASCAAAYPDLGTRTYALREKLEASPLSTSVRDVFSAERYDAIVDGTTFFDTLFQGLYSNEVIPILPQMIAELEQGDTTTITLLLTNDLANGAFFSDGMYLSVQCNEEVSFSSEQDIRDGAAAAGEIGRILADELASFPSTCAIWDAGVAEPIENEPVSSDIPTLVMAGEYDPITPPRWGEQVAGSLTNVIYLEFPGVGHGASVSDECPTSIALSFIDDPASPVDDSCMVAMSPLVFEVPGNTVSTSVTMEPFEEEVFGVTVSGLAPSEWEELGFGQWARQATFVDQTALVQQAAPGETTPSNLIGLFAAQLGFADDPVDIGTTEAGGRSWTLYEGDIDGFTTTVALGPGDGTTGILVLITSPEETEELRRTVLDPALEAFQTS
jgi:pimeloyl-ACP methyl ester carboxylesterase